MSRAPLGRGTSVTIGEQSLGHTQTSFRGFDSMVRLAWRAGHPWTGFRGDRSRKSPETPVAGRRAGSQLSLQGNVLPSPEREQLSRQRREGWCVLNTQGSNQKWSLSGMMFV